MQNLSLIYGPDPIFKKRASRVERVDDKTRQTIDAMFEILKQKQGLGLGANMVGILKRIIVIDLLDQGTHHRQAFINPQIILKSDEMQEFMEGSLSFPGIQAKITRPSTITINYLDHNGNQQTLKASGWLAQVIQHEIDYLDGITFLDHISKIKRQSLMKKYQKINKRYNKRYNERYNETI